MRAHDHQIADLVRDVSVAQMVELVRVAETVERYDDMCVVCNISFLWNVNQDP